MMRHSIFGLLMIGLAFSTANAADGDSGSEYFYQTAGGKQAVTGEIQYQNGSKKFTGTNYLVTQIGLESLGVTYEYGLNDMFSLAAFVSYESEQINGFPGFPSATMSGLNDVDLWFKGKYAMGGSTLHYGLMLDIPDGKQTNDSPYGVGNSNASSGGYSVDPYVGIDAQVGSGVVGGRFMYIYQGDRTISDSGQADQTLKGGSGWELAAFYEQRMTSWLAGGDLRYASYADANINGTVQTQYKNITTLNVDVYATIAIWNMELIPKLSATVYAGGDQTNGGGNGVAQLSGRWTF